MKVRIRDFHPPNRPTQVNGKTIVAKFTAHLDHFKIFQMKLVDCPDRGYLVWTPSHIQISMESRELIREKAIAKFERG